VELRSRRGGAALCRPVGGASGLPPSRQTHPPRSPERRDTISESPRERFLFLDPYRAQREWLRYEGSPIRDLFRELRLRFLGRNHGGSRWSLDVGCGPGRFLDPPGLEESHWVGIDLSWEMLRYTPPIGPMERRSCADRIRGDALAPPFRPGAFGMVQMLGNVLGFNGNSGEELWEASLDLVAPHGRVIVEIAPGPGEKSRYLSRLPPTVVARLLGGTGHGLSAAIEREGFQPIRADAAAGPGFRRWTAGELLPRLRSRGFDPLEVMAVAPLLGADPLRVEAVRCRPRSWEGLLRWEEASGRDPERWDRSAALLIAAQKTASGT
jgi:SAM-dependent methyltransferase